MADKYQKEIEEILERAGEVAPDEAVGEMERPAEERPRSVSRSFTPSKASVSTSRGGFPTITPGKVLMTGLVVFIITALLQIWVLIWVGLALLVVGYLLFFITPRNITVEKRWRGESLEEPAESSWEKFKRWMKS